MSQKRKRKNSSRSPSCQTVCAPSYDSQAPVTQAQLTQLYKSQNLTEFNDLLIKLSQTVQDLLGKFDRNIRYSI